MRLAVTLIFLSVVCGLVYFVFSHPGLDRLDELEAELRELEMRNQQLAEQNQELERQIRALREDSRLAERRARESVGLARPGELIFQFDDDREVGVVEVPLEVGSERLELAGEQFDIDELPAGLEAIHEDLPAARVTVEIDEDVGPVRIRRVVDIVEASELGPGVWPDEVRDDSL